MDESVSTTSGAFTHKDIVMVAIFAVLAVALYSAYRGYLKKSLAIQEAAALGIVSQHTHTHNVPVTTPNGKVEVHPAPSEPKVPVIRDSETGAVVESTEGPRIKENLPDVD